MTEVIEDAQAATAPVGLDETEQKSEAVAVVGLGYAGLPAAVAFGKRGPTIGYDASPARIESLMRRADTTGAVSARAFAQARHLWITQDPAQLARADCVLVAVPTFADALRLDLAALEAATRTIGRNLKPGAVVIYATTAYPGATEEVCVPILERASGRRWRRGFHVAYSPERASACDGERDFGAVPRLVAADDTATLERVAALFESVVPAGVYRVPSIRAAEAAHAIDGVQRDLNIALVNELAIVCGRLGLDTSEVLRAAETRRNFPRFRPGLPGGQALGVAPYYLAHAARCAGWEPRLITAGRGVNDSMAAHVAAQTEHVLARSGRNVHGARINVLGLAYKENCADVRRSQIVDLVHELNDLGASCCVHDPLVDPTDARDHAGLKLHDWSELPRADALILAVPHRRFVDLPASAWLQKIARHGCLVDVKSALDPAPFRRTGVTVWRL